MEMSWARSGQETHTAPRTGLGLLRKHIYLRTQVTSKGWHGGRVTQLVLLLKGYFVKFLE